MKHLNAGEYIAAQQEQIDRLQAELQEKSATFCFGGFAIFEKQAKNRGRENNSKTRISSQAGRRQ